jgi:hypothetical protein
MIARSGYSGFGIGLERKSTFKRLLHQEEATIHQAQKVYVYSETALTGDVSLCRNRK